jgi:cytochrome c peroxidase
VIRNHYARAGRASAEHGQPNRLRSEFLQGFDVSDDEVSDLIAFLESLTDTAFISTPRHSNPWSSLMR